MPFRGLRSRQKKNFIDLYAALKRKKENFRDEAPIEVPWLNERLATSCRSCRFEMPMDMLEMEKMTIQEYLLKYCRIARHRQILYKKLYERKANKNTGLLSFKELEASLCSVLVNSVDAQDIRRLFTALDLKKDSTVDLQLFMVICALAERILYISYTGRLGRAGVSRGFLESADFCALEWKLRGVNINPALKRLLLSLG